MVNETWCYLGASTLVDDESDDDDPKASRFSLRAFLIRDWPYLVMLALAVPAIAWLEQATLLLLLVAMVLVAIMVLYVTQHRRERGY